MKLKTLQATRIENIDSIDVDCLSIEELFESLCNESELPVDFNLFKSSLKELLSTLESISDSSMIERFTNVFDIQVPHSPLNVERPLNKPYSVVKVNHGFWEMLAFILSPDPSLYRQRNKDILVKQLESSQLLPVLMASVKYCIQSPDILFMQSLTSGVGKSTDVIQACSRNGLDPIRRGVLTGNLLQAEICRSDRLSFIDSFSLNFSYQQRELINLLESIPEYSAVLMIGPPHLQGVRVQESCLINNTISQYYLAVSPTQAMQKWALQLNNMEVVLNHLMKKHDSITIFFQGVVLGPMLAALIEKRFSHSNVLLFDFGRLLDIEVDNHTLSHTGSPLPNKSIKPTGFFRKYETEGFCFEVLSAR